MARVLITGAGSGLGKALAVQCRATAGMSVCGLDIAPPDTDAAHPANGPSDWIIHDMGAHADDSWAVLSDTLVDKGPFDLVVLNAGINATGRFEQVPIAAHLAVARVNLLGPVRLVQMLLEKRLLATGGRVIFISSLSVFTGYPGAASYAASKDGLACLARSLRKPLRKANNISVQLVCPGPMDTPHATRHAPEGARADRRIAPEKVARMILAQADRRFLLVPGGGARMAAAAGRAFPQTMTRIMGKVLFRKLA